MVYTPKRARKGKPLKLPFNIKLNLDVRTWNKQKVALYGAIGLIGCIVFGYIAAFALFAYYGRNLPQPGKLTENRENSTVFYDRNGKVLYEMYKDKNRVPVEIKDISKYLQQGTIAIEDKRFYQHGGISQIDLIRAAFRTALGDTQGASTLTQQLIKNVLLTSEQSLRRKIREAILAYQVEKKYTKDQILEMYLNEAPYGGTYWGVGSASRAYFNKSPKDLNLVESAILAGLPQNPSAYSPFIGKKDLWQGRTKDVLRRMREDNYITKAQEEEALKQLPKVTFASGRETDITAPHFVFYLRKIMAKEFGEGLINQGVKVKTTLDYDLQMKSQQIVKDEIKTLTKYKVSNGAAIAMDVEKGEILAYVGSHDYNDEKNGQYDVISQGDRQPGSTLKPIEYAVMFEKGYTPATIIMDTKTEFPNPGEKSYIPENYDLKYRGPVQIRFALANSLNVTAVKGAAMIGLKDFLQKCYNMGIESLAPTDANMRNLGLSASLGGGGTTLFDVTSAYTVFARGGTKIDIVGIQEITDYKGKVIFKKKNPKPKRVLSEEISFLISHILTDNVARSQTFGTNSLLNVPGKTVAVKTGTTNQKKDNYAVGYTKTVAVGVWVGNNDGTPMNQQIASGITGATPIWNKIMKEALKKYKDGILEKPSKVKAVQIDALLGGLPKDGGQTRTEYFIEGTEPTEVSPYYKKFKLSKGTNKLANEVEVRSGNYDEKEFIYITEKDPVSADGKNRWQEAIDAWAKEQSDERYKYPTETSDNSSDDVVISIRNPSGNSTVNENSFEVRAKIASLVNIKNIKIYANGKEMKSIDGDRDEINERITLEDGVYDLQVKAWNEKDKSGESTIKIGVKQPWDKKNEAQPTLTIVPSPTLIPNTPAP